MDTQKATLVIVLTLIIVVLFNLAIYAIVKRRRNSVGEVDLIRKAVKRARDPWGTEKADLEALAKRVAELRDIQPTGDHSNDQ